MVSQEDLRPVLADAALGPQDWIASAAAIIVISADYLTPATDFVGQPPYGLRGARYIDIEAGCTVQNMHLMAITQGIGGALVAGMSERAVGAALSLSLPIQPVLMFCCGVPAA